MPINKIACCTDFSKNAGAAFAMALELAKKYDAKLSIIHVLPTVINSVLIDGEWVAPERPDESMLLRIEEQMELEYGSQTDKSLDYELIVLDGHISSEIIRWLKENSADLVVMGSYGLSGMGLVFFGSVAKRVTNKAPCSVMIVRTAQE